MASARTHIVTTWIWCLEVFVSRYESVLVHKVASFLHDIVFIIVIVCRCGCLKYVFFSLLFCFIFQLDGLMDCCKCILALLLLTYTRRMTKIFNKKHFENLRSVCKCYLLRSVVIVVDGDATNTTNAMPCHRCSKSPFVLTCFPSIHVPGPFFFSIHHSFTFFFIIRRRAALLVITHLKRARCTLIAVP